MVIIDSLYDLLRRLLGDSDELEEYNDDPEEYLREHGFGDLKGADVHDAFRLVVDDLPYDVAQRAGDYYRTGGNRVSQDVDYRPPPRLKDDDDDDVDGAVDQITYITQNYSYVDDRDTITDNSVNTNISDVDGDVDFDQDIHNENVVASGDGAVAAGDDIDGPVQTGDGVLVNDSSVFDSVLNSGDDARIASQSDGVSFGSGDASSFRADDITVDDGSAFNVGSGEAEAEQDNSREIEDSFNRSYEVDDHSRNVEVEDSFNDDHSESTHDSYNEHDDDEVNIDVIHSEDTDLDDLDV